MIDLTVIGGGAAGIFGAITAKSEHPDSQVVILEKTATLLAKVRISGGGRCNVTHHCFDPHELVKHYPRGEKELLGPFHRFQPRDTVEWFESRGVKLKAEPDGRMFPTTNHSETIIHCLLNEARQYGVDIRLQQKIVTIEKHRTHFVIRFTNSSILETRKLLLATGSGKDGYSLAEKLGHTIQPPVPSLFTFNCPTSPLLPLSGVAISNACVTLTDLPYRQTGPLLITHFGFSGPAPLKLSAWAARELHALHYKTDLSIDWLPDLSQKTIATELEKMKVQTPKKKLASENPFGLPRKLWAALTQPHEEMTLMDISLKVLRKLAEKLQRDVYHVEGKTLNKEEFVTCGGVRRKEINFKTMESKITPGLYFAGEVIDIDGVTGGFNFQNAWTTGYIASTELPRDTP